MSETDFKIMVMSAVNKLLAQGEQSKDSFDNACKYRGNNGLCCIVGFMLDDDTAHKADTLADSGLLDVINAGIWDVDLTDEQINQLYTLQGCHDFADTSKSFNQEFITAVCAERTLVWVADYIGARA
jgi:hypothetical protein